MSFCFPYSSRIKAELTAEGDTARYRYRGFPSTGWLRSGGLIKYAFNSWKAFSHSGFHKKAFFRKLKKRMHLSVDQEMNRFNATILPVSYWSYLIF